MQLREMDERATYLQQLQEDDGPVVLINQFNLAPADVDSFLTVWADDATFMKRQPGFISTQLHRGTAGSTTFVNVAVWESASALGQAFRSPEFQARAVRYPQTPSPPRTCSGESPSRGFASPNCPDSEGRKGGTRHDEHALRSG